MHVSLHCKVSLLTRRSHALRDFDKVIHEGLAEEMKEAGMDVQNNTTSASFTKESDGTITISTVDGRLLKGYDIVLCAIGRQPLKDLNLEAANVKTGHKGYIEVNEFQLTSNPDTYALGDVCGKVELTPVAIAVTGFHCSSLLNSKDNCTLFCIA